MDVPPRELRLEARLLDVVIERVGPESEDNDRLVYHFLTILREMGYHWRAEHKVVLFSGEDEPEFCDEYAAHLDRLSCGLESKWEHKVMTDVDEE
jgi:hypothetical protein